MNVEESTRFCFLRNYLSSLYFLVKEITFLKKQQAELNFHYKGNLYIFVQQVFT